MATSIEPSTPPPPCFINTPSTPRLGGIDDNFRPYSPRKSTRVSQRSSNEAISTPRIQHNLRNSHSSPRSSRKGASTSMTTSPSSPRTASKKQAPRNSPTVRGRRVSGALNYDTTASAAAALGLPVPKNEGDMVVHRSTAAVRNNGMLPTPAKTPKKRPSENGPAITSVARNLFPIRSGSDEEVMPSPKKKGTKKYSGFTLDSFGPEEDVPIQIYTDSHDRVPEIDLSQDNPFYGEGSAHMPEPTKRASKRRKITVPGEREQTVEELEKREDGLVYTFRGKKMFRKFVDVDDARPDTEDDIDARIDEVLDEVVPSALRRPLTRSSIKPRLLFPSPQQKEMRYHNTEDEEADTDIEDPIAISTPRDQTDDRVTTPTAPKFAPATPPTTARATRSKNVDPSNSPGAPTSDDEHLKTPPRHNARRAGKVSPFDQWNRHRPVSNKREGEPLAGGRGGKKFRG